MGFTPIVLPTKALFAEMMAAITKVITNLTPIPPADSEQKFELTNWGRNSMQALIEDVRTSQMQEDVKEKTVTELTTQTFQVIPESDIEHLLLGRFSRKLGVLHKDDLGGAPLYIDIKGKQALVAAPDSVAATGKKQLVPKTKAKLDGLVYNLPGKATVKVYNNTATLAEATMPLAQFGSAETLATALFTKKKDIKITLEPHTGALLKVEE